MIWLTWRQFRTQAVVAFAALAALAVALGITGPQLAHLYQTTVVGCAAHGDCAAADSLFVAHDRFLQYLAGFLIAGLPGLLGLFWGAPLIARELEAGTHRMVWNQSVTRGRWLAIKLGLTGLVAMTVAGLFSLIVTWWSSPVDRVNLTRFTPGTFIERGVVPIGYAAFAFVLGVTAGMLIRRAVPAMAVTLAVFAAIQVITPLWLRPHLVPPVHTAVALTAQVLNNASSILVQSSNGPMQVGVNLPGAWVLSTSPVTNAAGHVVNGLVQTCGTRSAGNFRSCLVKLDLKVPITYQPASRFWMFQWYETAIFLGLAAALAWFCFWWIRRHSAAG